MSDEQRQLLQEFAGETRRQFEIVAESLRREIRQVAEGVALTNESIDSVGRRMDSEFAEVKAAMKFSFAELDRRIGSLEAGFRSLDARVKRLETGA
jgi:hypothetical protein